MFETHKSGNKTSSGEIGVNIRTLASSKVGQDQGSGGVSGLCWRAVSVANVRKVRHPLFCSYDLTPDRIGVQTLPMLYVTSKSASSLL